MMVGPQDSSKTTLDEFEVTTTRVGEKSPWNING